MVKLPKLLMLSLLFCAFGKMNLKLSNQKKNSKGTRKYTPDNLKQIQFVYHLVKEKGMTLAGAKKQMNQMGNPEAKVLLLDKLKKIRAELQSIKDQL